MRRVIISLLPLLTPRAATSAGALSPRRDEVSMGTTILAVRYDGGVVVGADTRTSVSGYVSNRHAAKLTFVLDGAVDDFVASSGSTPSSVRARASTCVICRSGSAADTQRLASAVRTEMVTRQLLHGVRGTVTQAASLLRNMLVDNEDLSASLLCAGYDHDLGRGVIYSIAPGGTIFEERAWAAGGSGSTYILGHLDSERSERMKTEEEALEFVCDAVGLAMERDGSSGGFVRMYVINRFGKRFVSKTPKSRGRENGGGMVEKRSIQSFARDSLKNFAPAVATVKAPTHMPPLTEQ